MLAQEVHVGERISLSLPLHDGGPDLRLMLEVRHVRPGRSADDAPGPESARWRAGGQFRNLQTPEHERVIRFIFAELRSRQ